MKRCFVRLLTVLSLLLCVAVCVLWVRSYWVRDQVRWGTRDARYVQINSGSGHVAWTVCRNDAVDQLLEWSAGADPAYHPVAALPDPNHLQRFQTAGRLFWSVSSGRNFGPLRIEQGDWSAIWGLTQTAPDPWVLGGFTNPYVSYRIALWPVVVLAGAIPAGRLTGRAMRRWLSDRRLNVGLCASCGYDLRATPGRCPECGTDAEQGAIR